MPSLFQVNVGFFDGNIFYISDSGPPGNDSGPQDEAPVGSQYVDIDNGLKYRKTLSGSGTDRWNLVEDTDISELTDGSIPFIDNGALVEDLDLSYDSINQILSALELNINGESVNDTLINNWNTAFSWGNHAAAGYLTIVEGNNLDFSNSNGTIKSIIALDASGNLDNAIFTIDGSSDIGKIPIAVDDGFNNAIYDLLPFSDVLSFFIGDYATVNFSDSVEHTGLWTFSRNSSIGLTVERNNDNVNTTIEYTNAEKSSLYAGMATDSIWAIGNSSTLDNVSNTFMQTGTAGTRFGNPAGGFMGTQSINASAIYENGHNVIKAAYLHVNQINDETDPGVGSLNFFTNSNSSIVNNLGVVRSGTDPVFITNDTNLNGEYVIHVVASITTDQQAFIRIIRQIGFITFEVQRLGIPSGSGIYSLTGISPLSTAEGIFIEFNARTMGQTLTIHENSHMVISQVGN